MLLSILFDLLQGTMGHSGREEAMGTRAHLGRAAGPPPVCALASCLRNHEL